jgi:ankyrin repeat protein
VAGADDVVSLLIAAKAKLDVEYEPGITALFMAAAAGTTVSLTKLLEAGANQHLKDSNDLTPLDIAKAQGHNICAMFLR